MPQLERQASGDAGPIAPTHGEATALCCGVSSNPLNMARNCNVRTVDGSIRKEGDIAAQHIEDKAELLTESSRAARVSCLMKDARMRSRADANPGSGPLRPLARQGCHTDSQGKCT